MSVLNIIGSRLYNQQISQTRCDSPAEVVGWMGAVQAQDYMSAKWAVGLRVRSSTDAAVDQALADGSIIRTHVMRPTWHFVSPADVRWMLELTASHVSAGLSYQARRLGLDKAVIKRSNAEFVKALKGGKQLTRIELARLLKQPRRSADELLRFTHLLIFAELDGIICSGGRRGRQFTYALLDKLVPPARALKRDEALAELTRRYFTSHGPATVQDYVWWSGLTIAEARAGLELVKPQITNEVVDGVTYWFASSAPPAKKKTGTAYLLPNFDEYMVGYSDRSGVIDPDHLKKLDGFGTALLGNSIVMDGRIVGTWKRTFNNNTVVIKMNLFDPLNKSGISALNAAVKRYGKFFDMPVLISLSA